MFFAIPVLLIWRLCKGAFKRPSEFVNPCVDIWRGDTNPRGPFRDGQRFSVERQVRIGASVGILLPSRRPYAVFWLVVSVVVDSFNRMIFGRPFSHVGKKVGESFVASPSVKNTDSSAAISVEVLSVWIRAALNHCLPYRIDRMFVQSVLRVVLNNGTSTRGRKPFSEIPAGNKSFCSAIAFAHPKVFASFVTNSFVHNNPSPKSLACNVNEFAHGLQLSERNV